MSSISIFTDFNLFETEENPLRIVSSSVENISKSENKSEKPPLLL